MQRVGRLDPFLVVFSEDGFLEFSVRCPVHVQVHVFLGSVEDLDEDVFRVR